MTTKKLWPREINNLRGHHGKSTNGEIKKIANGKSIQKESTKQSICFVYKIEFNGVVTSPPNPSGDANDGSVHAMALIKNADFQYLRLIEGPNRKFSFLRSQKRKLRRINGKLRYNKKFDASDFMHKDESR
jgi:hypothetical protein